MASATQISEAMCWLRQGGKTSPSHSESVTRWTRNRSCVTTSTITMKAANARDVAYWIGRPQTLMKPPRPVAKAPTGAPLAPTETARSEEHTSELQSLAYLVCRLLLEKKKKKYKQTTQQTCDIAR